MYFLVKKTYFLLISNSPFFRTGATGHTKTIIL
nr:MAG TPA: hypothetical protein [Caudoviricetes sp.]DAS30276.1 MAG TPA: hypothetical protein [Caudoviricetes sp.]